MANKKWVDPPEDYRLPEDWFTQLDAVIEAVSWSEFHKGFFESFKPKVERFGANVYVSDKQHAIIAKTFYNAMQDTPKPTVKAMVKWADRMKKTAPIPEVNTEAKFGSVPVTTKEDMEIMF